jgi:hypothetical protein
MYIYSRGPIPAFCLIFLTNYMLAMDRNNGKSTPPHIITVRESINSSGSSSDEQTPVGLSQINGPGRIDTLTDLPDDDDSDEAPLTAHQMAQHYLSHFEGNTTAALPHLVAVLEQDKTAKCNLGRCIESATRGGIQPLFVKTEKLIHIKTPRGQTRGDFLSELSSAMPIAQGAVQPVVDALIGTSTKLEASEKANEDITAAHEKFKGQAKWKTVLYTAGGSISSLLLGAGLTIASSYIGSLTPGAPQTIQCVLTLTNSTL